MTNRMTKLEFKARWESNAHGGGITFDDVADCAKAWGLFSAPKTCRIERVRYAVLKAAGVNDAEEFNPDADEDRLNMDAGKAMSEQSCYTCGRQLTMYEAGAGDGNCADCFEKGDSHE